MSSFVKASQTWFSASEVTSSGLKRKSAAMRRQNSKRMRSRASGRQAESQPSFVPQTKPFNWYGQLLTEQREAADFVIERGGSAALFCQQRTGKTYITCAVIQKLKFKFVLVVAPLVGVETVWVPRLSTLGNVLRSYESAAFYRDGMLVVHWQYFVKYAKKLAKLDWDMIVLDESQGIKNRNSAQSRAARKFRNAQGARLALSGTPMDDTPIDIWGQMRFVDHTVFGESWTEFADEFCYKGGFKNKQFIFDERKRPEFNRRLKPHAYRLTVAFLKLKPVNIHLVPIQMFGEQRRIYQKMESTGLVKIGKHVTTSPRAMTKKIKLAQITGGHLITNDGERLSVGNAKQRKLAHLAKKLSRPLVVFCQFTYEAYQLPDILRETHRRVKILHGKVKDKRNDKARTKLLADFQLGKVDAMVCQLRTGGVSIELTRARDMVLYSINHSFIDFEQILFRLQGMSQKHEVNVYLLFVIGTVDEEKVDVIRQKTSEVYKVVSQLER